MAKTKKPLSETEKAYNKELRRLRSFISRKEKKGFQFSSTAIPTKPKKITKASVRRLAKITTESLYKKAIYGGEATGGDIVSGEAGRIAEMKYRREIRREQRRQKQEKPQVPMPTGNFTVPDNINGDTSFFDKMVIGEYRRSLKYLPSLAYTLITEWVDNKVSEIGEHLVALMLEDGIRNGVILQPEEGYNEEKVRNYITEMENYFWMPVDRKADITDALESNENFNAY